MGNDDDLTEEQIRKMEAKLLGYDPAKSTVVQVRGKRHREKIDPSEFLPPNPAAKASLERRTKKAAVSYEGYKYHPEYGDPHWLINEIKGGKSQLFRRCETKAAFENEMTSLKTAGFAVTRNGLAG